MSDIDQQIHSILENWEIELPYVEDRLKEDAERPVYKIQTGSGSYILKGFSDDVPEAAIMSNVRAHLFLGNEKGIAPGLIPVKNGEYYIFVCDHWFYLMEFIEGRQMQETPEDEFLIGRAARQLHELEGYSNKSPFSQSKKQFYEWFRDCDFVNEFDAILDNIPDFEQLDQCFIHSDIGPHNMMLSNDGKVMFIDLDDAGIGSRYLDLGWPFIMQFVDFDHDTEEMNYRYDLAISFLKGYYCETDLTREEYDLIFYGAEQMHISYMQVYGPYAVDSLWKILNFGMDQKEILWEMINKFPGVITTDG